jgi:hypothetical protein
MDVVKINEFKRQAASFRRAAIDLRPFSAALSVKVDALASELEIRAFSLERGITP